MPRLPVPLPVPPQVFVVGAPVAAKLSSAVSRLSVNATASALLVGLLFVIVYRSTPASPGR